MNKQNITGLAVASIALAACQSGSYKIKGVTSALNEGDTVFLTSDMADLRPMDTAVVADGKFSFEGRTDSTAFCMAYSAKRHGTYVPFFIEPGTIRISISNNPWETEVSGTDLNDQWKSLNDETMTIGRKINRIADYVHRANLSYDEQRKQMAEIKKLEGRYGDILIRYASENIDNEFGLFIITYYGNGGMIASSAILDLIGKMPQEMRNRAAVRRISQTLGGK